MSGHIFWIPLEKETNHRLDTLIVVINNGFNSFIFTGDILTIYIVDLSPEKIT